MEKTGGDEAALTNSEGTLRDLVSLGELEESMPALLEKAIARIERYRAESATFHRLMDGGTKEDILCKVRTDCGKLLDRVDAEIERRLDIKLNDTASELLEPIHDYLHQLTR